MAELSEAVFIRTDTAEGVRFDVTPADLPSGTGMLGKGQGCAGLLGVVLIAVFGGIMVAFPFMLFIPAISSLVGLAAGIAIFIRQYRKMLQMNNVRSELDNKRAKVSLTVNAQGISYSGGLIAADDIVELVLRHPHDKGGYQAATVAPYYGSAALNEAGNAGARFAVEIDNRSFALMVRRKSISTPEILAQGLTWNTGEALRNDVLLALR